MKERIQQIAEDLSTKESVTEFEDMVFNLGLYALSKRDADLALKCFLQLKDIRKR